MNWQERAEKAEAELARLSKQEPLTWGTSGELMDILKNPIYSSPVPAPAVAAPAVPEGCAIVSRTLDQESWKRLCNADVWPVTPKSFQRMLDVLMEVALLQSAPTGEQK